MGFRSTVRRSLSLRLVLGIFLTALVILAAIVLLQYREARRWLENEQTEEWRRFATNLATTIEGSFVSVAAPTTPERERLQRVLATAARDSDIAAVALVIRDGTILTGDAAPARDGLTADVAPVFAGGHPVTIAGAGRHSLVVPVRDGGAGEVRAALYVEGSESWAAEDLGGMLSRFGLAAASGAVLGIALALGLLSWMVLRPMRALADQASRLALGDLTARSGFAEADEGDEITRLGRGLDVMAERIADHVRQLSHREERYREVVERAVDGIFTSDGEGVLLDVNPSGLALVHLSREEVLGRPIADFVHPDEVPAVAPMLADLKAGQTIVREWRMRLPDDTYVPIEVSATRLPDGRLQGITRDITARKQAEDELRRVLDQQRAIAELGQWALAETDVQRVLDHAAAEVAAVLSASFSEVLELLPGAALFRLRAGVGWEPGVVGRATVSAEDDTQAGHALARDAAVVVEDLRTETRFTGSPLLVDHAIVSGITVVIRGGTRPFGVLGVYVAARRRFTADEVHFVEAVANVLAQSMARIQMTDALKASDLRYRLAARATRDAMYDWDIIGNRTFWSEGVQLLFGHPPGAVGPGIEWWQEYIHPEDRPRVLRAVDVTLRNRVQKWQAQYRFRRADGSYAEVQDRAYVEYADDGTPLRAVGAIADVTEQQRAEIALRRQAGFVRLSREVAVTANEAATVEAAMHAILRLVCEHTGWRVGHALLLERGERGTPPPNVWHSDDPARFAAFRTASDAIAFERGSGLIGRVWTTRQPLWIEVGADSEFRRREIARQSGLHSAFACPVLVGTKVVGILEFFGEDAVAPASDLIAVMVGLGTQLGRVIERVLAEEHLREYAERLESLSRRLIDAQETERRHVARELHDEIGQALTAIKLNLQRLGDRPDPELARTIIDESVGLAEHTLQQSRDLSLDLRPALLDDLGLVPALRWYFHRQGKRAGFVTEFSAAEVDDSVPAEVATTCFRIAQEALTNVARHAQAAKVTMELSRRGAALELVVRDTGCGFDPGTVSARARNGGGSLGLLSMGERAALVGGELTINSAQGRGTEVRVRLPLPV